MDGLFASALKTGGGETPVVRFLRDAAFRFLMKMVMVKRPSIRIANAPIPTPIPTSRNPG